MISYDICLSLTSLSVIISRSSLCCHKWPYLVLFMAEKYSIVYTDDIFFIHSSVDTCLLEKTPPSPVGLHVLATVNSAVMNMRYMYLLELEFSPGVRPGVGLLDQMLALFYHPHTHVQTSSVAQMVKNLPAMQETQVLSLGQEDPLEKEMATDSSILAW